jgi:hypothetical protein
MNGPNREEMGFIELEKGNLFLRERERKGTNILKIYAFSLFNHLSGVVLCCLLKFE